MEDKCCKCERVTKYQCLECFIFVCNICSKFWENHDNFSEEEKLVRKCENCDGNQVADKQKKKKQTLEGFLGLKLKTIKN